MKCALWSTPLTVPENPTRAASAPAEVEDRLGARQVDERQVRVAVGDERRIRGAELQPLREPLECRGVLLVDELHCIAGS
jgi:hypothetical protein